MSCAGLLLAGRRRLASRLDDGRFQIWECNGIEVQSSCLFRASGLSVLLASIGAGRSTGSVWSDGIEARQGL